MIERIDNFLPINLAEEIRDALLSDSFPWYFNQQVAQRGIVKPSAFQFTHTFHRESQGWQSDYYPLVKSLIHVAEAKMGFNAVQIERVKANLRPFSAVSAAVEDIHQDTPRAGFKSLLYYVDDCDGDTLILDDACQNIVQQITPKFNSAILFDSSTWHSSSPPMQNKRRVVINSIFLCE